VTVVKLDSCSAIYLAKCEMLDLAADVYSRLAVTQSVYREAVRRGKECGYADAYVLDQAVVDGSIQVVEIKPSDSKAMGTMPIFQKLGEGEAETLYEALAQGCVAMVDDRDAWIAARALGVEYTTSLGLLIEGVWAGRLSPPRFDELMDRLASAAGIPPDRVREARRIARVIGGECFWGRL
jgi:predicted nucleic acid-binding protein